MQVNVETVGMADISELIPNASGLVHFYDVTPPDEQLPASATALIDNPGHGLQSTRHTYELDA